MIGRLWGGVILALLAVVTLLSFFNYQIPSILWWAESLLCGVGMAVFIYKNAMTRFVLKRLLETVFVVWIIATLTFVLMRILPGGPFDSEKSLPKEIMDNLARKYHLNDSLFTQYTDYLWGLLHLDFGTSYKYIGRDITAIIAESLPNSVQLGVYALIVSYALGITMGVVAGWKRGSWLDSSSMFLAISGVSLPSFLMAPIFIVVFSYWLGWFEPALWEGPAYYVLPTIVLGVRPAAVIARLTRASVLDVIHSDYIRTAKAKGLDMRTILFKHVLRNSLIPVLSLSGPLVATILTGSFVIEQIFAVPGVAKHLVLSVTNRDYPLVLGTTLLFSFLLVVANFMTDLLIAVVDPRVKIQ